MSVTLLGQWPLFASNDPSPFGDPRLQRLFGLTLSTTDVNSLLSPPMSVQAFLVDFYGAMSEQIEANREFSIPELRQLGSGHLHVQFPELFDESRVMDTIPLPTEDQVLYGLRMLGMAFEAIRHHRITDLEYEELEYLGNLVLIVASRSEDILFRPQSLRPHYSYVMDFLTNSNLDLVQTAGLRIIYLNRVFGLVAYTIPMSARSVWERVAHAFPLTTTVIGEDLPRLLDLEDFHRVALDFQSYFQASAPPPNSPLEKAWHRLEQALNTLPPKNLCVRLFTRASSG